MSDSEDFRSEYATIADVSKVWQQVDRLTEALAERPDPPVGGVYRKMAAVMAAIEAVSREGRASGEVGTFKYRKIDDIVDAAGRIIAENGLAFLPKQQALDPFEGRDKRIGLQLDIEFTLVDVDDGSRESFRVTSFGPMSPMGPGIAASYALKVWLAQTFLIPFGEEGVKLGPSMDLEHPANTPAEQAPRQSRRRAEQSSHPETAEKPWTATKWRIEMGDRGVTLAKVNDWLAAQRKAHPDLPDPGVLTNEGHVAGLPEEWRKRFTTKLLSTPKVEEPFDDAGSPSGDESDPDESAETLEEAAEMLAAHRGRQIDGPVADEPFDPEAAGR